MSFGLIMLENDNVISQADMKNDYKGILIPPVNNLLIKTFSFFTYL